MKLKTTLNFNHEIFLLDFVQEYYPEITDFTKINNLEINELNLLSFEYEGNLYELPLLEKNDFLKVLKFLWAIRHTDENLNIYFKTKSWKIFTLSLEDFNFVKWDFVYKIKKILDDN